MKRVIGISALVVGVAYPLIQLAVDCRAPDSEACVWGKAYLPLSLALSVVVLGSVVAIVMFAVLEWRRRARGKEDAGIQQE